MFLHHSRVKSLFKALLGLVDLNTELRKMLIGSEETLNTYSEMPFGFF
jgi:hypothetical protein